MNNEIASKLDANIVKFQVKIRKNLQLYLFSKDAIVNFTKSSKEQFKDYEFKDFLGKFKKLNFKKDSEIKKISYSKISVYGENLVKNELSDLIFILNISDFEAWLSEFFNLLFIYNHDLLLKFIDPSKNPVELSIIIRSDNLEDVWKKIINRHLSNKFYKGMSNILKDLLKTLNVKLDKDLETIVGQINEHSLSRNLIIHNKSKVNSEYIQKSGQYSRFDKAGANIEISEDYLFQQVDNVLFFMQEIRKKLSKIKSL